MELSTYMPFTNMKHPHHGQQFGGYDNVFYFNEVTKSNRWSDQFRLMIIKDDLQAIYLDDPKKILIRDEEIKAYNVLNL
jgi:hypothetical protein